MKFKFPNLLKPLGTIIQQNYWSFYPSEPFSFVHFNMIHPVFKAYTGWTMNDAVFCAWFHGNMQNIYRHLALLIMYFAPKNSIILSIRDMVVQHCYRRFGCETIHPTKKFISMNSLQMSCMITLKNKQHHSQTVQEIKQRKIYSILNFVYFTCCKIIIIIFKFNILCTSLFFFNLTCE